MIKLIKNTYIWGIYTAGLYLKINLLKKLFLKRSVLTLGLTMDFLRRFSV